MSVKQFLDTEQAAAFLGLSRRDFVRRYVDTGIVRVLRFPGKGHAGAKHKFLVRELDKLKNKKGDETNEI
jgi:Helix-turn-helix domain